MSHEAIFTGNVEATNGHADKKELIYDVNSRYFFSDSKTMKRKFDYSCVCFLGDCQELGARKLPRVTWPYMTIKYVTMKDWNSIINHVQVHQQ